MAWRWWQGWFVGLGALCSLLLVAPVQRQAQAQEGPPRYLVHGDGRDAWSLLDTKLINRQLFEQLAAPQQEFRLGRGRQAVAWAVDNSVGAQVVAGVSQQSRFHGFFVADAFVALRPLACLDVNWNLTALNPSASDGYRASSELRPGLALHLHHQWRLPEGRTVQLDFVAPDLDLVTLGRGLLVEQVPLEGHMTSVRWGGVELREVFGGRVFWRDDDLLFMSVSGWRDRLAVTATSWLTDVLPRDLFTDVLPRALERRAASYVGVVADLVQLPALRLSAEYQARLTHGGARSGVLLRADWRNAAARRYQVHLGYQARYYDQGFGPRGRLLEPTTLPNLPSREHAYVTNSFEYFGISQFYRQLSHTVMLETRVQLRPGLEAMVDGEYLMRWVDDPQAGASKVLYVSGLGRAPGFFHQLFYRAGLQVKPWPIAPHRVRLLLTNKQVAAGHTTVVESARRFVYHPVLLVEAEYFL